MWRTLYKIRQRFGALPKPSSGAENASECGQSKLQIISLSTPLSCSLTRPYFKKFCGSNYSKDDSRQGHKAKGETFYEVKHDWLDAVGWSGVLLLSWYLCQPFCCRKISSNPTERYAYQRLAKCLPEYSPLVECISRIVLDSPARYVLPTVNAVKSRKSSPSEAERSEALQRGCENLGVAHEKVTSSLKNFLGTECMQAGKHGEAFSHFSEAADANHPSAIFNLGICYEMGLGAKQSFRKAAELYRRASDLGHATAMYNLGVFHVHGWGGLEADGDEARQLFTAAAGLGQRDARRALNLDENSDNEPRVAQPDQEDTSFGVNITPVFAREPVEPRNNDLTDLWFKVLNVKLDNVVNTKDEMPSSVDSGVNDLSPTELDFL